MREITDERLEKYFAITQEALALASANLNEEFRVQAGDALDMIERYVSDAKHFRDKGDYVNAFAALNYAHGWLDCGARNRLFLVNDSRLFTVDDARDLS